MNMNQREGTQVQVWLENSKRGNLTIYYYFSLLNSVTPFQSRNAGDRFTSRLAGLGSG
jgi:hypothetical protein